MAFAYVDEWASEGELKMNPKLFISYSWSNSDHEQWVLDLATELRTEYSVDVILDKWDLKEGHDAHAFMEQMVRDDNIKKVLLICDKKYAEKANNRTGGAGTEAQIISSEIYSEQKQDKFVAVIRERDDDNKPYVPIYYSSRIYIDLSNDDLYANEFEKLLRWIYDKPLNEKPIVGGKKPSFLENNASVIKLSTTSRFRAAIDTVKNHKLTAKAFVREYLELLSQELDKLRITSSEISDDDIVNSIDDFILYRNQAIELFVTLSVHNDSLDTAMLVHRFFESLIPYLHPNYEISSTYSTWSFDNFKFIIHELFLYAVAVFLKYEKFEFANYLVSNGYYFYNPSEIKNMHSFVIFWDSIESLEYRNQKLQLNRTSLKSDMLKERSNGLGINFSHVMQADFILFLRSNFDYVNGLSSNRWCPDTLMYSFNSRRSFEIFARCKSKIYFEKVKTILGIDNKNELLNLFSKFNKGELYLPTWNYHTIAPDLLAGIDDIATVK